MFFQVELEGASKRLYVAACIAPQEMRMYMYNDAVTDRLVIYLGHRLGRHRPDHLRSRGHTESLRLLVAAMVSLEC